MMKIDPKNRHQIKLCMSTRCNFCRRACPIYEVTGMEFDSPRARMEMMNEALEGRIDPLEIMPYLNRCSICRKCTEACPHKIDVPSILLDFRSAVRKMHVPEPTKILTDKGKTDVDKSFILKTVYPLNFVKNFILNGNPFNEKPNRKQIPADIDFVFFPGCITNYKDKDTFDACIRFFDRVGSKYAITPACCYTELKSLAFTKEEISALFDMQYGELRKHKIITPCAGCYHSLKEDHKLDVMHISEYLLQHKDKIKGGANLHVSLHDPCKLGRYHGIYEQPREILAIADASLTELQENRKDSHCCGGGGGLKYNNPEIQEKICQNLIHLSDKDTTIVTNCSYCKQTINKNSKKKTRHLVEVV